MRIIYKYQKSILRQTKHNKKRKIYDDNNKKKIMNLTRQSHFLNKIWP